MTDVTQLSDEELMKLVNPPADVASMSDEDLLKAAGLPPPASYGLKEQAVRGAGLTASALAKGAVGAINVIPDAATVVKNYIEHPHVPSWEEINPFSPKAWPSNTPSAVINQQLDKYLPSPQTTAEKVASFGLGAEGGALVPMPSASSLGVAAAPSEFASPASQQARRLAQSLQQTQKSGLVVPPSTTNPTLLNKAIETIGGKEATQNQARVINQQARNALAAKDLGLKPEVFTPEAVAAVKNEAGQGYEAARAIPSVKTDSQYLEDMTHVLKESHGSNASFPGSANPDVAKLVDTYLQPEFTGDAGVSAIKLLRGKASDAYRTGNSELGMAYKGLSTAIEKQLERGAQRAGGPYADLVASLRQARKTYAQASTIEDAMDPQGNVLGPKLAAAWRRDEPLSGGIKLAAEHAASYPKASLPPNSSNISHLNMYGAPALSVLAEHATGSPLGLAAGAALPLVRSGSRSYLLSKMGQRGGLPEQSGKIATMAKLLAKEGTKPTAIAGAVNAQ
jgi:hypothetical protein